MGFQKEKWEGSEEAWDTLRNLNSGTVMLGNWIPFKHKFDLLHWLNLLLSFLKKVLLYSSMWLKVTRGWSIGVIKLESKVGEWQFWGFLIFQTELGNDYSKNLWCIDGNLWLWEIILNEEDFVVLSTMKEMNIAEKITWIEGGCGV